MTALRLWVAGATALSPDEAYYWVWSRALAPGFLDHPPMVALWIRAGTALLGPTALGVRLLAPLAAAAGSLLLVQAGADLLGDRRAGWLAALLLNATLLFGAGAVTMTPDTPLLFFWTATLWALARLSATGNGAWWLAAGVAAGLALDSKYTSALLAPAILLWLLGTPARRQWLRRPLPWLGAAMALAVFGPVLWWNAAHGWASFRRQGGRTADWQPARAAQYLFELAAGQIGLATPLLAAMFAAGTARAVRRGATVLALPVLLVLVPASVFAQHALGDRVQANWPAVIYPSAALLAASGRWRRWTAPAVILGAGLTGLVYAQSLWAPLPLPPRLDPTLLRLGGWSALAQGVAAAAAHDDAAFIAAGNYGLASELAWTLPPALTVVGVDPRWALFALPDGHAALTGRRGLLLLPAGLAPDAAEWPDAAMRAPVVRARGGVVAARYVLYLVTGRAGGPPTALLPRPE